MLDGCYGMQMREKSDNLAKLQDLQPVINLRMLPGRSLNQQRQTAVDLFGIQPFSGKRVPVLEALLYCDRVDPIGKLQRLP